MRDDGGVQLPKVSTRGLRGMQDKKKIQINTWPFTSYLFSQTRQKK